MKPLVLPLRLLGLAILAGIALAADEAPKEPAAKELASLIDKLGDEDADIRKDAEKKILAIGEPALPALKQAVVSHPDADVKLRSIVLRQDIRKKLFGQLRQFVGHTGNIRGIAVTSDGKRAISASMDQTLKVWDLETGKEIRTITGHTSWCWDVAISKDDKEALSSGALDGTMRLWDIGTGKELQKYAGQKSWVYGAAFSPDGKHVASGGAKMDTSIRIYDRTTAKETLKLDGHTGWVWRIAYSPDGKKLLSAGMNDYSYRIWDTETGKTLIEGKNAHDGQNVVGIDWSPDGKQVLTSGRDQTVKLWDAETGKLVRTYAGLRGDPEAIAFSKDGKRFLASADKAVNVLDTATGKIIHRFEDHTEPVFAVAWTPDGRKALSGGADNILRMWGVPR